MGYDTYFNGSLTIEPQLPKASVEAYNEDHEDSIYLLIQADGEETVELRDGEIVVVGKPGYTEAGMRYDDSLRVDSMTAKANTADVVALAKKNNAVANGIINAQGEESRDIWRVRVENNEVFVESPVLLWPSGEQESLGGY